MPTMIVQAGDSIPSIAKDNGFFWQTVWNHPQNADLKASRKNPNQLVRGDEVFVPDLTTKGVERSTESKHRFVRKGDPRANEEYVLELDGKLTKGKTDGEGKLEEVIPPNARGGKLLLRGGKEVIPIKLGHLDPVEELTGVQQRLNNLGISCGPEDGQPGDRLTQALKKFQAKYKLQVTGEPDAATRAKLKDLHP